MKTFGFLSKGMSLGLKYGFDSGISLDYIYKNQADGKLLLGKFSKQGKPSSVFFQSW